MRHLLHFPREREENEDKKEKKQARWIKGNSLPSVKPC